MWGKEREERRYRTGAKCPGQQQQQRKHRWQQPFGCWKPDDKNNIMQVPSECTNILLGVQRQLSLCCCCRLPKCCLLSTLPRQKLQQQNKVLVPWRCLGCLPKSTKSRCKLMKQLSCRIRQGERELHSAPLDNNNNTAALHLMKFAPVSWMSNELKKEGEEEGAKAEESLPAESY